MNTADYYVGIMPEIAATIRAAASFGGLRVEVLSGRSLADDGHMTWQLYRMTHDHQQFPLIAIRCRVRTMTGALMVDSIIQPGDMIFEHSALIGDNPEIGPDGMRPCRWIMTPTNMALVFKLPNGQDYHVFFPRLIPQGSGSVREESMASQSSAERET
jgi:hypothetical protein